MCNVVPFSYGVRVTNGFDEYVFASLGRSGVDLPLWDSGTIGDSRLNVFGIDAVVVCSPGCIDRFVDTKRRR